MQKKLARARISRICMPNPNILDFIAFKRTDGQTTWEDRLS